MQIVVLRISVCLGILLFSSPTIAIFEITDKTTQAEIQEEWGRLSKLLRTELEATESIEDINSKLSRKRTILLILLLNLEKKLKSEQFSNFIGPFRADVRGHYNDPAALAEFLDALLIMGASLIPEQVRQEVNFESEIKQILDLIKQIPQMQEDSVKHQLATIHYILELAYLSRHSDTYEAQIQEFRLGLNAWKELYDIFRRAPNLPKTLAKFLDKNKNIFDQQVEAFKETKARECLDTLMTLLEGFKKLIAEIPK